MFEFYKSIYDRPTLLVCSPHFRYRLSFFEIRLFLPWNCVLIQQIYLSIRRIENWNVDECDFDSRNDPDLFTDSRRPLLIEFQSRGALAPRPEKAFKPITILEFPAAARVSRGGIISWITEARDNNSPPAINWNLWKAMELKQSDDESGSSVTKWIAKTTEGEKAAIDFPPFFFPPPLRRLPKLNIVIPGDEMEESKGEGGLSE